MLMDGIEPPQTRSDLECPYCHSYDSEPLGVLHNNISIMQKCLHPLIVFEFCYFFASLYYITACDKKILCNYERGAFISFIVKFAVIKLRGGFKPRFCHTRSVVCPSWFSASNVTRLHCYITMLNVRVKRAATLMTSFLLNHRDKANIGNCPHE